MCSMTLNPNFKSHMKPALLFFAAAGEETELLECPWDQQLAKEQKGKQKQCNFVSLTNMHMLWVYLRIIFSRRKSQFQSHSPKQALLIP